MIIISGIKRIRKQSSSCVLWKKVFLEIFENSQENTCGTTAAGELLSGNLNKKFWNDLHLINGPRLITFLRLLHLNNNFSRIFN